jgi:hypothetical protein
MRELVMSAIFILFNFLQSAQDHQADGRDVIERKQAACRGNAIHWNEPERKREFDDTHRKCDIHWELRQAERKQERTIPKEDVIEDKPMVSATRAG